MKSFKKGDRIKWGYWHYCHPFYPFWRTKKGIFIRPVRHRDDRELKEAVVKFDGNKKESRVALIDLEPIYKD